MGKYQKESTILAIVLILFEVIVLFMYGFFVRIADTDVMTLVSLYPWLQDIGVMMIIGFGYLMTFVNYYGWSSLGYTYLLIAVVIQYYLLWEGFWINVFQSHSFGSYIEIGLKNIIQALFSAAACLISMGALLGRIHPLDLVVMVIC